MSPSTPLGFAQSSRRGLKPPATLTPLQGDAIECRGAAGEGQCRRVPRPLNKDSPEGEGPSRGQPRRDPRGAPGKQPKERESHETQILQPEQIPAGSVFKGYEDSLVQGLRIRLPNTRYRRGRYQTPYGETLLGELAVAVRGSHFDSELRSYILVQYYPQHVSQPLLLKQLWDFGVQISSGHLNRLLTERQESFHAEKAELLRVGLAVSSSLNVEDTAARHQGQNGYCSRTSARSCVPGWPAPRVRGGSIFWSCCG